MKKETKSRILWTLVLVGFFVAGIVISHVEGDPNATANAKQVSNNENDKSDKKNNSEVKNTKDVTIESMEIAKDSTGEDVVNVVIKNNTDKILKNVEIGILGYDKDGKPVKFNFGNDDIYNGKAENLNVKPGETKQIGWTVYPDGALKEAKVCVDTYEIEGSKMASNQYYQQWKKDNNKPLKK